jgi:hypothetical protein
MAASASCWMAIAQLLLHPLSSIAVGEKPRLASMLIDTESKKVLRAMKDIWNAIIKTRDLFSHA